MENGDKQLSSLTANLGLSQNKQLPLKGPRGGQTGRLGERNGLHTRTECEASMNVCRAYLFRHKLYSGGKSGTPVYAEVVFDHSALGNACGGADWTLCPKEF